ncbi:MAG: ammonia-forming cytochrome c nitrite reductase subunit c552 [Gammaproteobacteria bacterium]|nr:ammonia-forming cytochrome c nitrite reductase subunit c552 [Gammaproteobacteria bacterium]
MPARIIWLLVTVALIAGAFGATALFVGGDRRVLLIGATTDAHHQLEMSCETCHGTTAFADAVAAEQAVNKACRNCHEDELDDADDSHPRREFRNPRMAVYWEKLDARLCTTCHIEHRPEITLAGAVTLPLDFCSACHSEGDQDVRAHRPSHAAATFDTCASAGCHNFHDNRALYEDFLVKHADEPWLAASPIHGLSALGRGQGAPVEVALTRDDAVAPANALAAPGILDDWSGSGHAAADVNCGGCHATGGDGNTGTVEANWIETPSLAVCEDCHRPQTRTLALGRHGMRQHPKIAQPRDPRRGLSSLGLEGLVPDAVADWLSDPVLPLRMTVAEARLPMKPDAVHRSLHCGSCHAPHSADTRHAAVEACSSCHDDPHTRAYFESAHYELWRNELAGTAPPGAGVSCATCHMTKTEQRGRVVTSHNQNDSLRPNERMIRPVCLDCHSLQFSLDALADVPLIEANFTDRPKIHVESIDWAVSRTRDQAVTDG